MKLIQKGQSKKQATNTTPNSSNEEKAVTTIKAQPFNLETLPEEKKVENNTLTTSTLSPATSVEPVLSTPNANNRVTRLSLAPNAVLNGLPPNGTINSAQKLNTPTSILKKRGISKLDLNPLKSSSQPGANNDTPSKRRVSFCESIQVEEIEPNFNKSLFTRVTPKAQKSKVVLTPYFNKTNTALNPSNNSAQTSNQSSSANSIINSEINTISSATQPQQQATSTAMASTSSIESLKQNLMGNMSASIQSASSKLANVVGSAVGSQSASKLNPSHQRFSDQNCLLSPSSFSNNTNVIANQAGSLSVPSSPSLLTNFFSSKQSFLSQRSTKIQELKTTMSSSPQQQLPTPPTAQAQKTSLNASKAENTSSVNNDLSTATLNTCIYPKLKGSQSSIEALLLNETLASYLIKGAVKLLQSKNIFTIGHLCSINATELNNLPFKAPKLENFLSFIHKFDETESKAMENQEVLSKISACATTPALVYMGSVEEEMEKLEATNNFDTSIECEKESDDAIKVLPEKKISQEIVPSIQMETNEAPQTQTTQLEEDPIKIKIAKDLELMEKDLHEKIAELFKLKHLINSKNVDDVKDLKSKHDELTMQLRMKFY